MRYRTAAILSVVLVGGMFILPAVVKAVFLPSLRQGFPNPVPVYEQMILHVAAFCLRYNWLLALPAIGMLFLIAAFTNESGVRAEGRAFHDAPFACNTERELGTHNPPN